MAEYRRFIAYIYEYVNGMKERNVGFAKVESRNGVCRLQIHLQEIGSKEENLKILGFVRNGAKVDTMDVGSCSIREGNADFKGSTPSENFGNSTYTLDQISGMYLEGDGGSTYASAWDDEMIQIEKLRAGTGKYHISGEENALEEQEFESEEEYVGLQEENAFSKTAMGSHELLSEEDTEEKDQPLSYKENLVSGENHEQASTKETVTNWESSPAMNDTASEIQQENMISRDKEGQRGSSDGVMGVQVQEVKEIRMKLQENNSTEETTETNQPQNTYVKGETESDDAGQGKVRAAQAYAYAQNQPMAGRPVCANKGMMNNGTCLERKWQHFQRQYPGFQPFGDNEIIECIQIVPKDIMYLRRDDWKLGRNNFLMQGFYNHHHLLLGRHTAGGFVLGIPGYDENQERFLANMYGFIQFKPARMDGKNEKYGYWLRQVH